MTPRLVLARKKAREVLARVHASKPPIDVERVTSELGLFVHYEPYAGELSGMIHRLGDGSAVIGVNALHSRTRQRFTIAHEVGHYLLHKDEALHVDEFFPFAKRDKSSSAAEDTREVEANQFAAELLMPASMLRADLLSVLPQLDFESGKSIRKLARQYMVSEQAMTIRISTLGVTGTLA